jgi:hypothetical protein
VSSLLANGTRLLAVGCLGMVATAASLPSKAVGEAPRCVETAGLTSVEGEKAILDLALTPSPEESDRAEIYLMPECHNCVSVAEIDLASGVFSLSRKPFQVVSSQLILMDSQGKVLLYIENPYGFDGTAAVGRSASGVIHGHLRTKLELLHFDSYTAVLRVNGLYSNVVGFNTLAETRDLSYSDGPSCLGFLSIEPLLDIHGNALPNTFMAYFRNLSDDSVSLAGSTARSRLVVDGKEYHLAILRWAGIADLWAGKSSGSIVRLPSFVSEERKTIAVGQHEIQYKFGDCLSNSLQIKVEGR